jgi:ubiquinone biosynthesis protein
MFVKLGQVLSTRADLLPADVIAELSRLQDHVAPADPAGIEALLTAELGAPPHAVFASFDPAPVAAASIGQAHRARLATGESVIVKVQRPDVRTLVERDLDILLRMARALEARVGWAREYAVLEMTQGFASALREELDFRAEVRNIVAVAGSSRVRVPAVYRQWSTSRVLVMEYLDGVSVRHAEPVLAQRNADRHGLALGLLAAILGQVMAEGTFHADPHPGNVLVLRDGQLALIDFGSVGRLDPLQKAALRRLLLAVARRNPAELHDSLLDLAQASRPAAAGENLLESALAQFLVQHLGPGMVPDAAMFTTLFRLVADFGLVFSPVIAAVFRAMITLEGTLARLAPGFQIVEETRTIAASWLGDMLGPTSLRQTATDEALGLPPVLRGLPRRLDRITTSLERGTLTTRVRLLADERDRHFVASMVGRAVLAFLGAAFGITSVMLIGVRGGPLFVPAAAGTAGTSLFHVFGYVGLFFSLVLILRVIIAITCEASNATAGHPSAPGARRLPGHTPLTVVIPLATLPTPVPIRARRLVCRLVRFGTYPPAIGARHSSQPVSRTRYRGYPARRRARGC